MVRPGVHTERFQTDDQLETVADPAGRAVWRAQRHALDTYARDGEAAVELPKRSTAASLAVVVRSATTLW